MHDATTPTSDSPGGAPREPLGHLSRLGFALLNAADLDCCHIDAYDDVPLTTVVRTDEAVLGSLDELESRYPDVVAHQRAQGICALAAWPLPGIGSPVGGIVLFFDTPQRFGAAQHRLYEATARRIGPGLLGEGERVSQRLEADVRALAAWDVEDDAVDTAQLCVSELVTNAVMHAQSSSELIVHLQQGVLTVVVRDRGGAERPEAIRTAPGEREDPLRVFGRGLTVVDGLADRWGAEWDAAGATAWFVFELGHDDRSSSRTG